VVLKHNNQRRDFGFRVILPQFYPYEAPYVYLDERENPEIVELVDYIDEGNVMKFDYLTQWERNQEMIKKAPNNCFHPTYNLGFLLQAIFKLFNELPPLSSAELFGEE